MSDDSENVSLSLSPWDTWEGLTFEQVCKGHIGQIKQKLGIAGILTEEYAWFVPANKDEGSPGAQIDLLLTRRDGVVTICEIKFSHGEYEIDKDYDMNLRNKVSVFEKAQIQKNHFSS